MAKKKQIKGKSPKRTRLEPQVMRAADCYNLIIDLVTWTRQDVACLQKAFRQLNDVVIQGLKVTLDDKQLQEQLRPLESKIRDQSRMLATLFQTIKGARPYTIAFYDEGKTDALDAKGRDSPQ